MSRRQWAALRAVGGLAVVAALLWWLGPGPFLRGLRSVDGWSLVLAMAIGGITTLAAAWRWTVVAGGLGVRIPLPRAVAAYYQSQFLNATLPGGILGDVHRAVENGRDSGDLGLGVRAVMWERIVGQAVQLVLALATFLVLPAPVRAVVPVLLTVIAVATVITGAVRVVCRAAVGQRESTTLPGRFLRATGSDLRVVLGPGSWPKTVVASVMVVVGHLATFLIAAHRVDPAAGPVRVLPLAMLVLLAAALPLNVAGWGPREGVAAWAFGAAGLGTEQGAAIATGYGVLVIASCLPGAVALVVTRWRRARQPRAVARAGVGASQAAASPARRTSIGAPRPHRTSGRTEAGCG